MSDLRRRKPLISLRLRMTLLIILNVFVVALSIYVLVNNRYTNSAIRERQLRQLLNDQALVLDTYADLADAIFQLNINTDEVLSIVARAVRSESDEERNSARQELTELLLPMYRTTQEYSFRQLHFHEPDNTSFLRFHRPEKYGDDLTGVRYTVEHVNREHEYIAGFEEGRIFNGYRFVFPLQFEGEYIGSVEVSVSMQTVVEHLADWTDQPVQFILSRELVEQKVFEDEQDNYRVWEVDDNFVLDRALSEDCFLESSLDEDELNRLRRLMDADTADGEAFTVRARMDGEKKLLAFIPVRNFHAVTVGWIFSPSDYGQILARNRFSHLFTVIALLLSGFLVLFTIYYRSTQKKLETGAIFDSLTSVYRREVLFQFIQTEDERYKRYGAPYSVIMLDIDYFKKVNDSIGHPGGDKVLRELATLIKSSTRLSDIIGRYGGEEFAILLPETARPEAAEVAENLRRIVEKASFSGVDTLTISCGVSERGEAHGTVEDLIQESDDNLYAAKNGGRNRVVS